MSKAVALICNNSVKCKYSFNVEKTVLFQTIQFTQTIQFCISMSLVLFNP